MKKLIRIMQFFRAMPIHTFKSPYGLAAVSSEAVLLLIINCLIVLSLFRGGYKLVSCFAMHCLVSVLVFQLH